MKVNSPVKQSAKTTGSHNQEKGLKAPKVKSDVKAGAMHINGTTTTR